MRELVVDHTYDEENSKMFADPRVQPEKILEAQRAVWLTLKVMGASQKTKGKDFLILGNPFEHGGKVYSRILNEEIRGRVAGYEPPTTGRLSSSDLASNVVQNIGGVPLAWEHVGDGEGQVLDWHKGMGAEAKDGRVLFNLHYKDGWTALFHEPVHESAPGGGIGTSPRWMYEGYCEIFAAKIAALLGFGYNMDGVYAEYARETQKVIDFVGETSFARAYFLNDKASYGLMAPIFYEPVTNGVIAPAINAKYLPSPAFRNDVSPMIKQEITALKQMKKPDWYTRWVTLYGRDERMPGIPAPLQAMAMPSPTGGPSGGPPPMPTMGGPMGGPPPMPKMGGPGGRGGPGRMPGGAQLEAPPGLTGKIPPAEWPTV